MTQTIAELLATPLPAGGIDPERVAAYDRTQTARILADAKRTFWDGTDRRSVAR